MKNNFRNLPLAVLTMILFALAFCGWPVKSTAAVADSEKTYNGIISSVEPATQTLVLEKFSLKKKFRLGADCTYTFWDGSGGTATGLRAGQTVVVTYQGLDGVLIATRIVQEPLRFSGWVKNIDATARTVTIHPGGFNLDKSFRFAPGCQIFLRGGKIGALADVQSGNYVTLVYETPPGLPLVQRIEQSSEKFTGALTAIDLDEKTVKAKTVFTTKSFSVGDHCVIDVTGKTGGQLSDLLLGEKLTFTYDEINGVNVVNRIASAKDAGNP